MHTHISADTAPPTKAIFHIAWPLTLKAIMANAILLVDSWLVAGLGEKALSAMGLAGAIGTLMLGILLSFATASQIWIAQAYGGGQAVALKTGVYCGLIINLAVGCVGVMVILTIGGDILRAFAHTPEIATQALHFLQVFMIVILSESIGGVIASYFNGCGETRTPLYSYLIAVPVNVLASVVLIYGYWGFPALGLVGAAVGSTISSVLRTLFLAARFYRETGGYREVAGWLHGSLWLSIVRHLKFALPIAVTFISSSLANSVSTFLYANLSINAFAALTLIMPWVNGVGTFGIMWAQATGIVVAQMLGAQPSRETLFLFLRRAWRGAFLAAAFVAICYLAVCLSSGWIYSDLQSETKAALLGFLPILLIMPFPKGSNAICGNSLRAGGETVYVMKLFVAAQWLFRLPLTALLVLYLDASVVWVFSLLLMEEFVKFPAFHIRLFKGSWAGPKSAIKA